MQYSHCSHNFICLFNFCCTGFSSCSERESLSSCGVQASHCGGLPCCGGQIQVRSLQQLKHVGSAVVVPRLESTGSAVAGHGLSCSMVCGIFLDQGSNLCLLQWLVDSLPWATKEALATCFKVFYGQALHCFPKFWWKEWYEQILTPKSELRGLNNIRKNTGLLQTNSFFFF